MEEITRVSDKLLDMCEAERIGDSEHSDVTPGNYYPLKFTFHCYPPTKRRDIASSVHTVPLSVHTFCLSGTISQYLLVRFDLFLVQMISIMNSRYPIKLVKIDPLTLELLPLF